MNLRSEIFPPRPAWTGIGLGRLRRDLPREVKCLAVAKNKVCGHHALASWWLRSKHVNTATAHEPQSTRRETVPA